MDKTATYYETLIARYLSVEATPSEVEELNAWLKADEANQKLFKEYRKSWMLSESLRVDEKIDVESEWNEFMSKTDIKEEAVTRKLRPDSRRRFLSIAAVLLVLILPSLVYFLFIAEPNAEMLFAEYQLIESTLPDGTQVTLNKGATLTYPKKFRGEVRNVKLEGEAYFDVAHNKDKAFIIEANDLQIKVLGTSFYVHTASTNNTMEVVLMEGSVQLDYLSTSMKMQPGDKATVHKKTGKILKNKHKDPNLLAWKTKKLQFDDTPLSEIIELLNKVYHKDIVVLNPEILNCRITASFNSQSFESILLVLQSTIDITARPNGSKIELSGKGCQ